MYCVVVLENDLEVKVIPVKFIKGFDPVRFANEAVDQAETHIIFYNRDDETIPDFKMALREKIDKNISAY